jgi:hypothetical protein
MITLSLGTLCLYGETLWHHQVEIIVCSNTAKHSWSLWIGGLDGDFVTSNRFDSCS